MFGLEEAHGQQHQLGLDDLGLALRHHQRAATVGIGLPVYLLHAHSSELSIAAEELQSVDVPPSRAAFLVRGGGLQRSRIARPRVGRVVGALHGARHDFYLRHAAASLTVRGADAVAACVAAAYHQDILSLGCDALLVSELDACQHAVLLRQQLKGKMNAPQLAPGSLEVACRRGARGNDVGIKRLVELRSAVGKNHILTISERYAFGLENVHSPVDDGFVEFEIGYSVAQKASCGFVLLVNRHAVAHQVEVAGSRQASRSGTHDSHALAVSPDVGARLYVCLAESSLGDGCFVLAVGGRLVVVKVQHTSLLAQCRTDAARKFGKGIGGAEQSVGPFPLASAQCLVPLGSLVAQRTSPVAERHTAVHAARSLLLALARVESLLHFAEVVYPVMHRTVASFLPAYL